LAGNAFHVFSFLFISDAGHILCNHSETAMTSDSSIMAHELTRFPFSRFPFSLLLLRVWLFMLETICMYAFNESVPHEIDSRSQRVSVMTRQLKHTARLNSIETSIYLRAPSFAIT
jgi:hypothetical protein